MLVILREIFDDFATENDGCIRRRDLVELIHDIRRRHILSSTYLEDLEQKIIGDKNPDAVMNFDEFCDFILQWRQIEPQSLEVVYQSWMDSAVSDFGDGEGGFVQDIESARIKGTEEVMSKSFIQILRKKSGKVRRPDAWDCMIYRFTITYPSFRLMDR